MNYYLMIDWHTELKTQPPFLTSLSDEEVLHILEEPLNVPKWPNHTQTVQRRIRVMAEACTEVAGYKAGDGYIGQQLSCRRIMPTFRTKNKFNFLFNRFACFWSKGYQRGSLGKSHQNGDYLKQAMRKKSDATEKSLKSQKNL